MIWEGRRNVSKALVPDLKYAGMVEAFATVDNTGDIVSTTHHEDSAIGGMVFDSLVVNTQDSRLELTLHFPVPTPHDTRVSAPTIHAPDASVFSDQNGLFLPIVLELPNEDPTLYVLAVPFKTPAPQATYEIHFAYLIALPSKIPTRRITVS
jgi:hypothetical protein